MTQIPEARNPHLHPGTSCLPPPDSPPSLMVCCVAEVAMGTSAGPRGRACRWLNGQWRGELWVSIRPTPNLAVPRGLFFQVRRAVGTGAPGLAGGWGGPVRREELHGGRVWPPHPAVSRLRCTGRGHGATLHLSGPPGTWGVSSVQAPASWWGWGVWRGVASGGRRPQLALAMVSILWQLVRE